MRHWRLVLVFAIQAVTLAVFAVPVIRDLLRLRKGKRMTEIKHNNDDFNDSPPEKEKPGACVAVIALNKANDQHLLLALACFNLIKDKLGIPKEELANYLNAAGKEVAELKVKIYHQAAAEREFSGARMAKAMKFDA